MVLGALRAVCVVLEGPGNWLCFYGILGPPLGPQDPGNMELGGKSSVRGAQQPTQSRLSIPFGLVFKTANLQTATCKIK